MEAKILNGMLQVDIPPENANADPSKPADGGSHLACRVETVAAWMELLGLDDPALAVHAMIQARDPGVIDKETSRNAWTSAYEQTEKDALSDLNQTSRAALHQVLDGNGSLIVDGRSETRHMLGLDTMPMTLDADDPIAAALSDPAVAESIRDARTQFIQGTISHLMPKR